MTLRTTIKFHPISITPPNHPALSEWDSNLPGIDKASNHLDLGKLVSFYTSFFFFPNVINTSIKWDWSQHLSLTSLACTSFPPLADPVLLQKATAGMQRGNLPSPCASVSVDAFSGTTAGCPIPFQAPQPVEEAHWLPLVRARSEQYRQSKVEFASRTCKGMQPLSLQILKAETFALGIKKVVTEFVLIQKIARYWSAESWTGENDLPWWFRTDLVVMPLAFSLLFDRAEDIYFFCWYRLMF